MLQAVDARGRIEGKKQGITNQSASSESAGTECGRTREGGSIKARQAGPVVRVRHFALVTVKFNQRCVPTAVAIQPPPHPRQLGALLCVCHHGLRRRSLVKQEKPPQALTCWQPRCWVPLGEGVRCRHRARCCWDGALAFKGPRPSAASRGPRTPAARIR